MVALFDCAEIESLAAHGIELTLLIRPAYLAMVSRLKLSDLFENPLSGLTLF